LEVDYVSMKVSPLKRKLPSTNPEAVRKRLSTLENNPDSKVLLARELKKAGGGGGCKDCREYAHQCARAHAAATNAMEGREETDQCFQKMTAMHEGFVAWTTTAFDDYRQRLKEVHEIADLLKEENARLKRRLAMKHGRTPTGRGRGRPKKLVNTDGTRVVPKRAAGSEEEEEEEEE
jgi:hypothetical protein